jgi:peroxiredoxin
LALTPELPDRSISTTEKHQLQFEVLSDVGNKVAKQYGIVFKLTDAVAEVYQEGFDLHGFNGDESDELPLAATYVIDQNGVCLYVLDAEYTNRAEAKTSWQLLIQ